MLPDFPVARVLLHYTGLTPAGQTKCLGAAGGFSGAQLWHVTTPQGVFCLRRWPAEHPDPVRLEFIHQVLRHAARQGLPFVPAPLETAEGRTCVDCDGHRWELAPWLAGRADFSAHPTAERLRAAVQALARFHEAAASFTATAGDGGTVRKGPPLAVLERRQRLERLLAGEFDEVARAVDRRIGELRSSSTLDSIAQHGLSLDRPLLASLQEQIGWAARRTWPQQPAIRDIWHDHVLFTGDEVTGIVDYGALRIDTPLTDIARLVGSLVGDDAPRRQAALDAYAELRPLSADDRWLVDLLDRSGVVLGALNWLTWLYVEQREFADMAAVERRFGALVARLRTFVPGSSLGRN